MSKCARRARLILVYIYIYIYVYIKIYDGICITEYIYIYICIYTYVYIRIYILKYICICIRGICFIRYNTEYILQGQIYPDRTYFWILYSRLGLVWPGLALHVINLQFQIDDLLEMLDLDTCLKPEAKNGTGSILIP